MRHVVIAILCAVAAAGCGDRRERDTRNNDLPERRSSTTVPTNPPVDRTVDRSTDRSMDRSTDRVTDRSTARPATGTFSTTPRVRDNDTLNTSPRKGTVDVDNTGVNVRDRNDATVTPPDQKNDDADIKRTADIRKRIVDAKLSSDGTNVKVITQNGRVTVRGPVKSQDEKDTILRIAREVAGDTNVDDELEIESGTGTGR